MHNSRVYYYFSVTEQKRKQLRVFQPSIEFSQAHELAQLLKQNLDKYSTR